MFAQMTMGKKLMMTAAVLLGCVAVLSLMTFTGQRSTRKDLDEATKNTAKRLELAHQMKEDVINLRLATRNTELAVVLNMKDRVSTERANFEQIEKALQGHIRDIRPLLMADRGRAAVSRMESSLAAYRKGFDETIQLTLDGKLAEADENKKTKQLPYVQEMLKAGDEILAVQQEQLARLSKDADERGTLYGWVNSLFILLSLTVGVTILFVIRSVSRTLRESVWQVTDGATQVASAASQVSSSSQAMAQGASEQAASLEETSSSTEEINSMTQKNAENSRDAAQLMAHAATSIDEGNKKLQDMVASMHEINASSEKISKIIKVIDEIAFQTNILALNAAVEAARAGEAGMGFAVVADEVRNLAQRCAQAARDTAGLIEESIAKSHDGSQKLDEVTKAITAITEDAGKVKTLIDEVSLGSQEQARGLEQVSKAITQMEQVTQKNAASAEEGAAAAEELNAQSTSLQQIMARLTVLVGSSEMAAAESADAPVKTSRKPRKVSVSPAAGVQKTAAVPAAAFGQYDFPMEETFKES